MIKKLEKLFKALGDRNRLRIINMLAHKPLCVCEITCILQVSQSTVSGHLRVLKEAELVIDEKDGMWVNYHLNEENAWANEIIEAVKKQALQDSLMENDIHRLKRVDRKILCKQ